MDAVSDFLKPMMEETIKEINKAQSIPVTEGEIDNAITELAKDVSLGKYCQAGNSDQFRNYLTDRIRKIIMLSTKQPEEDKPNNKGAILLAKALAIIQFKENFTTYDKDLVDEIHSYLSTPEPKLFWTKDEAKAMLNATLKLDSDRLDEIDKLKQELATFKTHPKCEGNVMKALRELLEAVVDDTLDEFWFTDYQWDKVLKARAIVAG